MEYITTDYELACIASEITAAGGSISGQAFPSDYINGISTIVSVGENATMLLNGTIKEFVNSQITSVTSYAFTNASYLSKVDLQQCTNISRYAFSGCSWLYDISLPACQSIGEGAFEGCTHLGIYISLPACTSIGSSAFKNCSNIIALDLPTCSFIGTEAFAGCEKLTYLSLASGVTIESNAFSGVHLEYLIIPENAILKSSAFTGCDISHLIVKSGVNASHSVFQSCTSLYDVIIEDNVSFGYNAFDGCLYLSKVYIGENVTFGNQAFLNCTSINALPFGFTRSSSIYTAMFSKTKIYGVDLPVNRINEFAFCSCSFLSRINLPNCSYLASNAFGYNSQLSSVSLPNLKYAWGAFANCSQISYLAFNNCIGGSFYSMSGVSFAYLPRLSSVNRSAFVNCSSLTTVVFSDVSYFYCPSVSYPLSLYIVQQAPFYGCLKLRSVYLLGSSVPLLASTSNQSAASQPNAFVNSPMYSKNACNIYVPEELVSQYKTTKPWSYFSSIIIGLSSEAIEQLISNYEQYT